MENSSSLTPRDHLKPPLRILSKNHALHGKIASYRAPIAYFPLRKTPQNAPIQSSSKNRIFEGCLTKQPHFMAKF